jgi:hypothetical protein
MDDNAQHDFIFETLLQFDQILKITTIELWQAYTYKVKQLNAANNLKAKMTALQVIEASAATAEAFTRATSLVDENHEQDLQTKLRLSNLENILKQNEQKTNELVNTINNKNKYNNRQKNFTGSRATEPASSPFPKALLLNQQETQPQLIVDLTEESADGKQEHKGKIQYKQSRHPKRNNGKQNPKKRDLPTLEKSVHWTTAEIKQYDPDCPATPIQHNAKTLATLGHAPPFFQPAPPPIIAPAPTQTQIV